VLPSGYEFLRRGKMISPFELDRLLGLNYFISNTAGVKGKLRQIADDFSVDEVFEDSREDDEGEYLHFIMEKRNWDTIRAVDNVSRALHISRKRFGYAGTKDKRAVTKQRMSVWNIERENLEVLNLKDIKLYNFVRSDERLNLGDLLGNKFKITIRKTEGDISQIKEVMQETVSQLSLGGVPNYFGYQRFGIVRPNTHLVGKKIIQGDLDGAVMQYIAKPYPGEREDTKEAREMLSETGNFKKALEVYPSRLNYERNMLDALVKNPKDFAGALRRLPKKLRRMLVHACQSHIFNEVLSEAIAEGINIRTKNIKLLGYKSGFSQDEIGRIEKEVLEREDLTMEQFKINSMPEVSVTGEDRRASINTKISFDVEDDELNPGLIKVSFSFFLPPGSYATTVLREFMKTDPLNY